MYLSLLVPDVIHNAGFFPSCPSPWCTLAFLYLLAVALEGSTGVFVFVGFFSILHPPSAAADVSTLKHCAHEPGWPADGTVAEQARLEVRRT